MADIDFGRMSEALNEKLDRDLGNPNSEPNVAPFIAALLNQGVDLVIQTQLPTAANNYTWYRKYASGWVEQGWRKSWNGAWTTVTLPVRMADTNYTCTAGGYRTDSSPYQQMTCFRNYTTTTVDMWSSDDTTSNAAEIRVFVCGMAA